MSHKPLDLIKNTEPLIEQVRKQHEWIGPDVIAFIEQAYEIGRKAALSGVNALFLDERIEKLASAPPANELVKHMVDRFLGWKLPESFNPDGGISFKRMFNEKTPWPMKNEPTGTNLLDAAQAESMVRYMLEGISASALASSEAAPSTKDDFWHKQYLYLSAEICKAAGTPTDTFNEDYVGTDELLARFAQLRSNTAPQTGTEPRK